MGYTKKKPNLPGQSYYRYDDGFKRKILADIDAGLIGERKSASLYNFNRKNLSRWRLELKDKPLSGPEKRDEVAISSDLPVVAGLAAVHRENKLLKEQLIHTKLYAEALQTIIEVAELDLGFSLKKKPLSKPSKS